MMQKRREFLKLATTLASAAAVSDLIPESIRKAYAIEPEPGSTYLVWIWGWQLSNVPDGHAFLALMSMTVPLISLTSAPPPVIH